MAWTDSCKVEACAQIKKKAENSSIRDAIKRLSEESGIPIDTLSRWYWPRNEVINDSTQSTLIKQYEAEQEGIEKDSEVQVLQQASEVRQAKKKKQEKVNSELKETLQSQPPPEGKYQTIVIDPPWPIQKIIRDDRPNQDVFDYPTMSIAEITNFDINQFADDNCHIYLWSTHKFLPIAFLILDSWGFRYQCLMVWHKPGGFQPFGMPQFNCEFILLGKKGSLAFLDTKSFPCCFNAARGKHSEKPNEFYELVRRVSPGPRIDIFARKERKGWDVYGNEV